MENEVRHQIMMCIEL